MHSKNQVTDLSTESGNLFKMAAKTERILVQNLETGQKQKKKGGKGKLNVFRIIEKDSNNM